MRLQRIQDGLSVTVIEQDCVRFSSLNVREFEPQHVKPPAAKGCRTVLRIVDGDDENILQGGELARVLPREDPHFTKPGRLEQIR
jgi:hypothetical protein